MVNFTKRTSPEEQASCQELCVPTCLAVDMICWDARITHILPWHTGLQILNFHSENSGKMTLKRVTNIQFYRHSKLNLCLTAVSLQVRWNVLSISACRAWGLLRGHQPGPAPPFQPWERKLMAPEQAQPRSPAIHLRSGWAENGLGWGIEDGTGSAGPVGGQGKAMGSWRSVLLWHFRARGWQSRLDEVGSWVMSRVGQPLRRDGKGQPY